MFNNIISDNVLKEPYFFLKKEQYQSTHHCFLSDNSDSNRNFMLQKQAVHNYEH